jgi:Domain of unknown function (DUF4189)
MSHEQFRIRLAICAASAVVGAALTVAVAPAAHADDPCGAIAIAISKNNTFAWGKSNRQTTEDAARKRAMDGCMGSGRGCQVIKTFSDCGAIFYGHYVLLTGTGRTKEDAENVATSQNQVPRLPEELTTQCPPAMRI